MARFGIREVFRLPNRKEIVLAGEIVEGVVKAGQRIQFVLQQGLTVDAEISRIEFSDRISTGESLLALILQEKEPNEAAFYADLCPMGTVLTVEDSASAA